MAFRELLKNFAIKSDKIRSNTVAYKDQATANKAETITYNLPRTKLVYGLDLQVTKDTDSTLVDNIDEIRVLLNGNLIIKKYSGAIAKAIALLNGQKCSTGFYKIYFVDPKLGGSPIPADALSSFTVEIDVLDGGVGVKNRVTPTLLEGFKESFPNALNQILVEKYSIQEDYGTATGEKPYDHERTQDILGLIYDLADDGARSDTRFSYLTLEGKSRTEEVTPYFKLALAQLKELNTQENNGNALATGIFALTFPEGFSSYRFTQLRTLLNIPIAGTAAQAKVIERFLIKS